MKLSEMLEETIAHIRSKTSQTPEIGLILGSGLGSFADTLDNADKIPTAEIPHYPRSTVEGHSGNLVFGQYRGINVLAVQGRTHYYEGYTMKQVTYVVRIMQSLGVKKLIVTNAAGGVNRKFKPGDLMIIEDHINMFGDNPLIGPNEESLGPRFPDMSAPYDPEYISLLEEIGLELNIPLQKGVLFGMSGPSYETPAEVRMIAALGGDTANMSTIPEVIVARHAGMRVCGISCITNYASGLSSQPLSHEEVTVVANQVKEKFTRLVKELIVRID
jgi:purine-nucleoside phosphorylase